MVCLSGQEPAWGSCPPDPFFGCFSLFLGRGMIARLYQQRSQSMDHRASDFGA